MAFEPGCGSMQQGDQSLPHLRPALFRQGGSNVVTKVSCVCGQDLFCGRGGVGRAAVGVVSVGAMDR